MKNHTMQINRNNKLYKRAIPFIDRLIDMGVPLSAIDTNDFNSSIPKIYVTREYGRIKGGAYKKYAQWSERTARFAYEFYVSENPTNKADGFMG